MQMEIQIKKITLGIILATALLFTSCASNKSSTIVGGEYNEANNTTEYFVLPYGSVSLPGKWEKGNYVSVSKQQFFKNQDSISVAIAFGRDDSFEFNRDGKLKGYDFLKTFFEWESAYFQDSFGLQSRMIETDRVKNYIIYNVSGKNDDSFNTIFLIGEKNGNVSNFSVNYTDKWSENEKILFLKNLYK